MRTESVRNLKEFVYEAKMRSFASKAEKIFLSDGSCMRSYLDSRAGKTYLYNDTYFGNLVDCGHEKVSIDGIAVWACQYYGGIVPSLREHVDTSAALAYLAKLDERDASHVIVAFLRKALRASPVDFPVRGPSMFESTDEFGDMLVDPGIWRYTNEWASLPLFGYEDAFLAFQGLERITVDGIDVYLHAYVGGLSKDKNLLCAADEDWV